MHRVTPRMRNAWLTRSMRCSMSAAGRCRPHRNRRAGAATVEIPRLIRIGGRPHAQCKFKPSAADGPSDPVLGSDRSGMGAAAATKDVSAARTERAPSPSSGVEPHAARLSIADACRNGGVRDWQPRRGHRSPRSSKNLPACRDGRKNSAGIRRERPSRRHHRDPRRGDGAALSPDDRARYPAPSRYASASRPTAGRRRRPRSPVPCRRGCGRTPR
jgi:hypothetical protein